MAKARRNEAQETATPAPALSADVADVVEDVKLGPVDPIPQATPAEQSAATSAWMGTAPQPSQIQGETDAAGEMWDPAVHSEKRSKTRDGRWRRKRGAGSGPRASVRQDTPKSTQDGFEPITGAEPVPPEIRPLAEATVTTFVGALSMIGGPGWKAESQEHAGMVNAWEAYYRARGIRDLPPEIMLCMVMGTYIGTRAVDEANTEGFRKVAERFTRKRMIPNARPDSGANRAGQVHVAPTPLPRVPITPGSDGVLHDSPERL